MTQELIGWGIFGVCLSASGSSLASEEPKELLGVLRAFSVARARAKEHHYLDRILLHKFDPLILVHLASDYHHLLSAAEQRLPQILRNLPAIARL